MRRPASGGGWAEAWPEACKSPDSTTSAFVRWATDSFELQEGKGEKESLDLGWRRATLKATPAHLCAGQKTALSRNKGRGSRGC
eukprot:1159586-Pelagomonas_calceolata.AAC.5